MIWARWKNVLKKPIVDDLNLGCVRIGRVQGQVQNLNRKEKASDFNRQRNERYRRDITREKYTPLLLFTQMQIKSTVVCYYMPTWNKPNNNCIIMIIILPCKSLKTQTNRNFEALLLSVWNVTFLWKTVPHFLPYESRISFLGIYSCKWKWMSTKIPMCNYL